MVSYNLVLPDDFEEHAWELESKGCYKCNVNFDDKEFEVTFYDLNRLNQDVEFDFQQTNVFYKKNLIIVKAVSKECMKRAVSYLAQSKKYLDLV